MRNRSVLRLNQPLMLLIVVVVVATLGACSGAQMEQGAAEYVTDPTLVPPPSPTVIPTSEAVSVTLRTSTETPPSDGLAATPQNTPNTTDTPQATETVPSPVGAEASSPQDIVAAFEQVLNEIYEAALPSIVYLQVAIPGTAGLRGNPSVPDDLLWSAGSGFVWDEEGHIVTNYHVVTSGNGSSDDITVYFADATQAKATLVGGDPYSDLAVLKLEGENWNLQPLPLGDSDGVRVGQYSVAIGAPFGQEFTMTVGIVSAIGRNLRGEGQFTTPEVIQTDAAINPGNSGGPLLNRFGRVIGINTQIISTTGNFSGVGMAVPVNIAKLVIPSLVETGEFNYSWLGVTIVTVEAAYAEALDLPPGTQGALIASVVPDSPADRAGLREADSVVEYGRLEYPAGGDVILAIDSHTITSTDDLIARLTYHNSPGDTVTLTVLRDGQQERIEVTLGERP